MRSSHNACAWTTTGQYVSDVKIGSHNTFGLIGKIGDNTWIPLAPKQIQAVVDWIDAHPEKSSQFSAVVRDASAVETPQFDKEALNIEGVVNSAGNTRRRESRIPPKPSIAPVELESAPPLPLDISKPRSIASESVGREGTDDMPEETFLSNIPGQRGFEEFSDIQKRLRRPSGLTIPGRPPDDVLAGAEPTSFSEQDRDAMRQSVLSQFDEDPFAQESTDLLEQIEKEKPQFINEIGRGRFTFRSLPNQSREVQERVETAWGKHSANLLKRRESVRDERIKMVDRATAAFDKKRSRFEAQRKRTDAAAKTLKSKQGVAQKEILKLRLDLLDPELTRRIRDGDKAAATTQKLLTDRIKVLEEVIGPTAEEAEAPKAVKLADTPAGRARAQKLKERGVAVEPLEEAAVVSATNQAMKELRDAGALDGRTAGEARELVRDRAEQIFRESSSPETAAPVEEPSALLPKPDTPLPSDVPTETVGSRRPLPADVPTETVSSRQQPPGGRPNIPIATDTRGFTPRSRPAILGDEDRTLAGAPVPQGFDWDKFASDMSALGIGPENWEPVIETAAQIAGFAVEELLSKPAAVVVRQIKKIFAGHKKKGRTKQLPTLKEILAQGA